MPRRFTCHELYLCGEKIFVDLAPKYHRVELLQNLDGALCMCNPCTVRRVIQKLRPG